MRVFEDVAASRLGKMLDAKQQTGKYSYPYLANFNVQWFRFNIENLNQMDFDEDDRAEFELKDGDLLVCEGGEIGRCAVWHNEIQPCFFQKALHRVRCNRQIIHPDYLAWWFKYNCDYDGFTAIAGSKATIAHLPGIKLKQLQVAVPPIELQEQFATFVEQTDKSRFIEMFGDCVVNPKGWKTKCLEDIAEVGSSKRVFIEELQEAGIPFYRGTEVGPLAEGKQISPELFITEEHYTELCKATGAPQIGDLLMPSICPDGRIWVVNTEDPFYFKDGRVLWVHAIDNSYNPVFLLYTLKDRIMADYSSIASGTTFAELKIFALKKCRIFDVPIELQNQFAAFVVQTDKSKYRQEKCIRFFQCLEKNIRQEWL